MPPERFAPDDPREWLRRARGNLALARANLPEVALEELCYEAQQAAEKALKALLIKRAIRFPYVHDLDELLKLLLEAGEEIPLAVGRARRLTRFAFESRYPSAGAPVTLAQWRSAVATAEAVVAWVEERLAAD